MSIEIDNHIFEASVALRKTLHQYPETAFEEEKTADLIKQELLKTKPDKIVEGIAKTGMLFFYKGKKAGKTKLFRAELDALPIAESNQFEYKSKHPGKGHKCGHDGHASILVSLAQQISDRNFAGEVILLFQPAEETGEGALAMLKDEKWESAQLNVDAGYALHNLPHYPLGELIWKKGVFASASKGLIISLKGKPSHASHPKDGINPSFAVSQIIQSFYEIPQMNSDFENAALITPIGFKGGEKAFGISAHQAEVYATLRTHNNSNMELLCKQLKSRVESIAQNHQLELNLEWVESFEAVENNDNLTQNVVEAARKLDFQIRESHSPFAWSEDFGHFSKKFPLCLFGLGSGESHPQLHNEDYDFPDELIKYGSALFYEIVKAEKD